MIHVLTRQRGAVNQALVKMDMKPNFFIVGAARCGTTTLSRCLKRHPQVCFSQPKEPHYFSQMYGKISPENIQTDYLEKFSSL
jgi:hypothetical protein